jgi:hypothetical protein
MDILAISLIALFFGGLILSSYLLPDGKNDGESVLVTDQHQRRWDNGNGIVLTVTWVLPDRCAMITAPHEPPAQLQDLAKSHTVFAVSAQALSFGSALTARMSQDAVLSNGGREERKCKNGEVLASTEDNRLRSLLLALDGSIGGRGRQVNGLLIFEQLPEPEGELVLRIPYLFDHTLDMFQKCSLSFGRCNLVG